MTAAHPMLFRLTDVRAESGGPFHIINTTLNTTSSTDARLRARNGENMILTPLVLRLERPRGTAVRLTTCAASSRLSTAFSVSGAAVDPDTYATKSRPVSFLMALLNVRLGVWVPNPRQEPRRLRWPAWYQLMLREMLGVGLTEKDSRIHLADGGHFENLGLYELLRRRCRYIIVSDAGADPALHARGSRPGRAARARRSRRRGGYLCRPLVPRQGGDNAQARAPHRPA